MGTGRSRAKPSGRARQETSRSIALRVVRRVTEQGAYSTLALAAELQRASLSARDRQFAADLVYGTLRRLIPLDHALRGVSNRRFDSLDPVALALVRLGAYQLLFTRVPDHAAVSETVGLAGPRHRGFVNAVLRKVAAVRPLEPEGSDDDAISLRTGLAAWAVAELRRVLPEEDVEPSATALASPADLSLRVNRCRTTAEELTDRLGAARHEARPGRYDRDVVLVPSATPSKLPGFVEGHFAVQDEASVLVVAALGVRSGERVLDAAAAPGGKATHLACLAGADGVVVGSPEPGWSAGQRSGSGSESMSSFRTPGDPPSGDRSTRSSWMRRARASERPGGARSCCGGRRSRRWPGWPACRSRCFSAWPTWSGRADDSSTRCARFPEPRQTPPCGLSEASVRISNPPWCRDRMGERQLIGCGHTAMGRTGCSTPASFGTRVHPNRAEDRDRIRSRGSKGRRVDPFCRSCASGRADTAG